MSELFLESTDAPNKMIETYLQELMRCVPLLKKDVGLSLRLLVQEIRKSIPQAAHRTRWIKLFVQLDSKVSVVPDQHLLAIAPKRSVHSMPAAGSNQQGNKYYREFNCFKDELNTFSKQKFGSEAEITKKYEELSIEHELILIRHLEEINRLGQSSVMRDVLDELEKTQRDKIDEINSPGPEKDGLIARDEDPAAMPPGDSVCLRRVRSTKQERLESHSTGQMALFQLRQPEEKLLMPTNLAAGGGAIPAEIKFVEGKKASRLNDFVSRHYPPSVKHAFLDGDTCTDEGMASVLISGIMIIAGAYSVCIDQYLRDDHSHAAKETFLKHFLCGLMGNKEAMVSSYYYKLLLDDERTQPKSACVLKTEDSKTRWYVKTEYRLEMHNKLCKTIQGLRKFLTELKTPQAFDDIKKPLQVLLYQIIRGYSDVIRGCEKHYKNKPNEMKALIDFCNVIISHNHHADGVSFGLLGDDLESYQKNIEVVMDSIKKLPGNEHCEEALLVRFDPKIWRKISLSLTAGAVCKKERGGGALFAYEGAEHDKSKEDLGAVGDVIRSFDQARSSNQFIHFLLADEKKAPVIFNGLVDGKLDVAGTKEISSPHQATFGGTEKISFSISDADENFIITDGSSSSGLKFEFTHDHMWQVLGVCGLSGLQGIITFAATLIAIEKEFIPFSDIERLVRLNSQAEPPRFM